MRGLLWREMCHRARGAGPCRAPCAKRLRRRESLRRKMVKAAWEWDGLALIVTLNEPVSTARGAGTQYGSHLELFQDLGRLGALHVRQGRGRVAPDGDQLGHNGHGNLFRRDRAD